MTRKILNNNKLNSCQNRWHVNVKKSLLLQPTVISYEEGWENFIHVQKKVIGYIYIPKCLIVFIHHQHATNWKH